MLQPLFPPITINAAAAFYHASLDLQTRREVGLRFDRGRHLALAGAVSSPEGDDITLASYQVASLDPTRQGTQYKVSMADLHCTCPDWSARRPCKHLIAVQILVTAYQIPSQAASPEVSVATTIAEPALPSAYQAEAVSDLQIDKPVVWAMMDYNEQRVAVEVLQIQSEMASVRALPRVNEQGKLRPQFPFLEGQAALIVVPQQSLYHIRIFQRPE